MKIKWYGHSAFLITSDEGIKIIMDPYEPGAFGGQLSYGRERGTNTVFTLKIDNIQLCHLGDLGHLLSDKELAEIGPVDILLIPVGGFFTIDPKEATQVAEQIKPKILIPMHFKTANCGFPIAPVEDFLKGKEKGRRPKTSEINFDKKNLPQQMEVVVLEHSR